MATKKTATKKVAAKKTEKLTDKILGKTLGVTFLEINHKYITNAPTVKIALANIKVIEEFLEELQDSLDDAKDEME